MEAEELRKKLKQSEELLEQADERQEEVEADIDHAHEHADVEDASSDPRPLTEEGSD